MKKLWEQDSKYPSSFFRMEIHDDSGAYVVIQYSSTVDCRTMKYDTAEEMYRNFTRDFSCHYEFTLPTEEELAWGKLSSGNLKYISVTA